MKNTSFLTRLCIYIFVALCLLHYFSLRPLWLDEVFVYVNIVHHDYGELFAPLVPAQSFPRVYLIGIKAFASFFDNHVLALRFFSLVSMLAAFLIWVELFKKNFKNPTLALLAVLSIVASYKFSYYGAELKQYSMDVLVVAIFSLFFHYQRNFEERTPSISDYLLVSLLPLLLFFSYAGIFVFWIVAFNLFLLSINDKKILPLFFLSLSVSILCFSVFYWVDVRHSITVPGVDYWKGKFICTDSFLCFWDRFGDGVKRLVIHWIAEIKPIRYAASIFIPFCMFALFRFGFSALKKDRLKIFTLDALSLVLFGELFILGILKLYPFTGERITLFLAPFMMYMILRGLDGLIRQPLIRRVLLSYFTLFYLLCLGRTLLRYLELYPF